MYLTELTQQHRIVKISPIRKHFCMSTLVKHTRDYIVETLSKLGPINW